MDSTWINAPAKINLGLDVIRRRDDGYHEVKMIMQSIRLFDRLTLKKTKTPDISLTTNLHFLPVNEDNLVYKSAKMLMEEFGISEGVSITLDKRIPVAAGMAGGSTDAASCMIAMNQLFDLGLSDEDLKERGVKAYENKEAEFPEAEQLREVERVVLLKVIDARWMDHIDDMDQLRQGIGLQAYGQRDPLVEYKMTGYEMFGEMTNAIAENTIRTLFHIKVEQKVEREEVAKVTGTNKDDSAVRAPKKREEKKIYPNDPCPCGSGKKYKQCCGRKIK